MLIINTGGTFNKVYNPLSGELEVLGDNQVLERLLLHIPSLKYDLVGAIFKDSLEMTQSDREELSRIIQTTFHEKIVIVHGTDTLDVTASYLSQKIDNKVIVLTGAIEPFSINTIEATANFSLALGFLEGTTQNGVYVAMHGIVDFHERVYKNRSIGQFQRRDN